MNDVVIAAVVMAAVAVAAILVYVDAIRMFRRAQVQARAAEALWDEAAREWRRIGSGDVTVYIDPPGVEFVAQAMKRMDHHQTRPYLN